MKSLKALFICSVMQLCVIPSFSTELLLKEKCGFYVAEKYLQQFNYTHSFSQTSLTVSNKKPAFFEALASENSTEELSFKSPYVFGGEASVSFENCTFSKDKYNNIYMIDNKGNYYFKLQDSINSTFEYSYPYEQILKTYVKNFFNDANIPESFCSLKHSDKLTLNNSYENNRYLESNGYRTDLAFTSSPKFIQIEDNQIMVLNSERDWSSKQEEYIFTGSLKQIEFSYNNFDRAQAIILRNQDILCPEELKTLSKEEIELLINTIYAKHGKSFSSKNLQKYFIKQSWYYRRTAEYNDSDLSIFDLRNLELLNSQNL